MHKPRSKRVDTLIAKEKSCGKSYNEDFQIPGHTQAKDENHEETTSHNIQYLNYVHQNGHHM